MEKKYYDTDFGLNVYLILKDAPYQESYEKKKCCSKTGFRGFWK